MRRGSIAALVLVLSIMVSGFVRAQKPEEAGASVSKSEKREEKPVELSDAKPLLTQWSQKATATNTFDVVFTRTDESPHSGDHDEFQGRLYISGADRVCMHFQKLTSSNSDEVPKPVDVDRVVETGKELMFYDFATRAITYRPVGKPNQIPWILSLPYFLKFNIERGYADFAIKLESETEKDALFAFTPKDPADRRIASRALVQVSKSTWMPERVLLLAPDGISTQDYAITRVRADGPVPAQFFEPLVLTGWQVFDARKDEVALGQR